MAGISVNRGLLRYGQQAFQSTNYNVARYVRTMSADDSATTLTAGTTTLGSPTNEADQAFDATPTESGQTIIFTVTFATGVANFTIRRLIEHDDTTTNVTGTSATVVSGVDSQQITKNSDFSAAFTKNTTFASA